jgi:DNA (cytosine-5)-methyltransferase 1
MTHGSLFSGIGGFDLAAQWCGWTNVFQCEIDPFCRRVLKYHWPNTELYENVKTTNFTKYRGKIDIISGGFPCQPFSTAGKRKGTEDDRHLWPEMLRVIREVQPAWVVAENVSGLLTQQRGLVFERVCADLEGEGYEVQPFIVPACAVNAPHRRDRVWIVANRANAGIESVQQERENGISQPETIAHPNRDDAGRCGFGQAGSPHGKTESQWRVKFLKR